MSKKKEKKPFDPEHMTPEEQLKFEIAEELAFTFLILFFLLTCTWAIGKSGVFQKKTGKKHVLIRSCGAIGAAGALFFWVGNYDFPDTYNIGGFNEWKNIDLIKVIIKTVDRLLGNPEGTSECLITYVTDRKGHDLRYAIDSNKLKHELGWEPSLQFEEGIERTVRWYLDNQEWMDHITSGEYEKYYESMYKNR